MDKNLVKRSKLLSLVLRHDPGKIGIELDESGWVDVERLLEAVAQHGQPMSRELLDQVVETNDKKRFALSEDGLRIRANQGHSVQVDLKLEPAVPPEILYHGSATRFLDAILHEGLDRRQRQHVHLSADIATATKVGQRHGKVVILEVDSAAMSKAGHVFFLSQNGVWLTDKVAPEYLKAIDR